MKQPFPCQKHHTIIGFTNVTPLAEPVLPGKPFSTSIISSMHIACRLDQQIAALDQLQAVLDQAPRAKMPCPRMAAEQQASKPDMLAYMASSRFGPALLSSLAEQVVPCLACIKGLLGHHTDTDVSVLLLWNCQSAHGCIWQAAFVMMHEEANSKQQQLVPVLCTLQACIRRPSANLKALRVPMRCRLPRTPWMLRRWMLLTWTTCQLGALLTGAARVLALMAAAAASSL